MKLANIASSIALATVLSVSLSPAHSNNDGTVFHFAEGFVADAPKPLRGNRVLAYNAPLSTVSAYADAETEVTVVYEAHRLPALRELGYAPLKSAEEAGVARIMLEGLTNKETPLPANLRQELMEAVTVAKRAATVPISVSQSFEAWAEMPELAAEVDIIGLRVTPFEDGISADEAIEYALQQWVDMQALYPSKKVVVTHLDWPESGPANGAAVPSAKTRFDLLSGFDVWSRVYQIEFFVPRPNEAKRASL